MDVNKCLDESEELYSKLYEALPDEISSLNFHIALSMLLVNTAMTADENQETFERKMDWFTKFTKQHFKLSNMKKEKG